MHEQRDFLLLVISAAALPAFGQTADRGCASQWHRIEVHIFMAYASSETGTFRENPS
jgi:hypothetical protein